jgi:hypothetical protein
LTISRWGSRRSGNKIQPLRVTIDIGSGETLRVIPTIGSPCFEKPIPSYIGGNFVWSMLNTPLRQAGVWRKNAPVRKRAGASSQTVSNGGGEASAARTKPTRRFRFRRSGRTCGYPKVALALDYPEAEVGSAALAPLVQHFSKQAW